MFGQGVAPKKIFYINFTDVEDIMGLKRSGRHIQIDESLTSWRDLPKSFQHCADRDGIRIKSLTADIVIHHTRDDDFIRRFLLVILGTVLAPVSKDHLPISYYSLVRDVKMAKNINRNFFTLEFLNASLDKFKEGSCPSCWPSGNLALLQYAHWEKVRPVGFDFGHRIFSLMRRWDEKRAYMRDQSDRLNGRDAGIVINDLRQDDINYQSNSDAEDCFRTPEPKRNHSYCDDESQEKTLQTISSVQKEVSDLKKRMSTLQKGMSVMNRHVKHMPYLIRCLQKFFDEDAESEPAGDSDNSQSYDPSDCHKGSAKASSETEDELGPAVAEMSDGVKESDKATTADEFGDTVAERVKDRTRKTKTPSSLRSPMTVFKNEKKKRKTSNQSSQKEKEGEYLLKLD